MARGDGTGERAVTMRVTRSAAASALLILLSATAGSPARADLSGHGGPVTGLAVLPDGRHVLSASFDYSLVLWDLSSGAQAARMIGHDAAVNAVALMPDGQ